jgi:hypothetical protein
MTTVATVLRMLIRACAVVLVLLGILFWTGNALGLRPLHQFLGFVLVLSLWTLAVLAARAGASLGLVAGAAAWGLVVPILGLAQTSLLTGSAHWVIRVLHLLVGLAAVGLGEALAGRVHALAPATRPQAS